MISFIKKLANTISDNTIFVECTVCVLSCGIYLGDFSVRVRRELMAKVCF